MAAVKSAAGSVYHSSGDDPASPSGEVEMPACVLPLYVFDQFIVTPAGQSPPSLADSNFPSMGSKRYTRKAEYAEELKGRRNVYVCLLGCFPLLRHTQLEGYWHTCG